MPKDDSGPPQGRKLSDEARRKMAARYAKAMAAGRGKAPQGSGGGWTSVPKASPAALTAWEQRREAAIRAAQRRDLALAKGQTTQRGRKPQPVEVAEPNRPDRSRAQRTVRSLGPVDRGRPVGPPIRRNKAGRGPIGKARQRGGGRVVVTDTRKLLKEQEARQRETNREERRRQAIEKLPADQRRKAEIRAAQQRRLEIAKVRGQQLDDLEKPKKSAPPKKQAPKKQAPKKQASPKRGTSNKTELLPSGRVPSPLIENPKKKRPQGPGFVPGISQPNPFR